MLPVVWLLGTSGVGKSTAGWLVRANLAAAGVTAAFVDADQLRLAAGVGTSETELVARGLRALEPSYRDAGARLIIVAGIADDRAHLARLLPGVAHANVLACHLHADGATIRDRIRRRGHLVELTDDSVDYAARIDRDWADLRIDTTSLAPQQVAATISRAALTQLNRVPQDATRDDTAVPTDDHTAGRFSARVLLVAGAGGVGASTIGFQAYTQLAKSGQRVGYLDLHQLGFVGADPRSDQLACLRSRNGRVVAAVLAASGVETVVITADLITAAAVVNTPHWHDIDVVAFELSASPTTIANRIKLRAQGHGPPIAGDHRRGLSARAINQSIAASVAEATQHQLTTAAALRISADAAEPAITAAAIISSAGLSG